MKYSACALYILYNMENPYWLHHCMHAPRSMLQYNIGTSSLNKYYASPPSKMKT